MRGGGDGPLSDWKEHYHMKDVVTVLLLIYAILVVAWFFVHVLAWADTDKELPAHRVWDPESRSYEVVRNMPNPERRMLARGALAAPLWPLICLRGVGRFIGEFMMDAHRKE